MMKERQMTISKLLLPLPLLVITSACVSLGGKAPPSMLVLTAQKSVAGGTEQTAEAKDTLVVLIPDVPRKLDTNRLPVQVNDSNIAYIKDAIWADKPARLMQMLLMETIAASNNRLVLNEVNAGNKTEDYLAGTLLEFGIDEASKEAVVVYDAVRLQNGKAVEKKRFEARQGLFEITAATAGSALNTAANSIASDVAAWLKPA
jgi:cholesterol transport system auxiliary component